MKLISIFALLILLLKLNSFAAAPYAVILGIGQDAGIPQMGCETPFCRRARSNPKLRQMVASIALVDPDSGGRWIFDATPDLPLQFDLLKDITRDRSNNLTGIFLTHAHIGHYTGLMYLGREAMNTRLIPVYAMPLMAEMLRQNAPWSQLAGIGNIELHLLRADSDESLNERIKVRPFLVPHRDEFSETVGYKISSSTKSLIYIPDIDKWSKWPTPLAEMVKSSDYVLIDGTFFADGEIPRPMSEVPHPFITETMALLADLPKAERSKVRFIHLNHSNPIVQGNRKLLEELRKQGFRVGHTGERLQL